MRLVLTVLPDRGDPDRVALRKHMRWALSEVIGPLRAHTHATACLKGRLAENVDAVLDMGATEPYTVAIVAGVQLFLALALVLRPTVRPAKYVVFLGAEDLETPPPPSPTRVQEPRRRSRWRWRWRQRLCGATARPPPVTPTPLRLPSEPRLSVLMIDTTGTGSRHQPWVEFVAEAMGHADANSGLFRWQSSLAGGENAAARDGARILDFVG